MTLNGVMALFCVISANSGSFRGALRKSSRSLSHLLMSSCTPTEIVVCSTRRVERNPASIRQKWTRRAEVEADWTL